MEGSGVVRNVLRFIFAVAGVAFAFIIYLLPIPSVGFWVGVVMISGLISSAFWGFIAAYFAGMIVEACWPEQRPHLLGYVADLLATIIVGFLCLLWSFIAVILIAIAIVLSLSSEP
ncbi:MAG: hypothetical protein ABIA11_02910 [Patescibacteria group bacterium]